MNKLKEYEDLIRNLLRHSLQPHPEDLQATLCKAAATIEKLVKTLVMTPDDGYVPPSKPIRPTPLLETMFYNEHHQQQVRKHWDYLIKKYDNMPFRSDTSESDAGPTNDAINLVKGILKYTQFTEVVDTKEKKS